MLRYLYVIYATLIFVITFLLFFPFILLFGLFNKPSWTWQLIRLWSIIWLGMIGMPTQKIFINSASVEHGKIIIANHASYLDTPLIFRVIPFMARPLAKYELSKIPLFGYLYKQLTVLVDRKNAKSKAESLKKLRAALDNGESIFIFPEGTFNETEEPMGRLYDGAFRLALETETDLQIILFPDTRERFNYRSFWFWSPGVNRIIVYPPISIQPYLKDKNVEQLKNDVKELMSQGMQTYQSKSRWETIS